jgi:hypothetical protein
MAVISGFLPYAMSCSFVIPPARLTHKRVIDYPLVRRQQPELFKASFVVLACGDPSGRRL